MPVPDASGTLVPRLDLPSRKVTLPFGLPLNPCTFAVNEKARATDELAVALMLVLVSFADAPAVTVTFTDEELLAQ